MKKFIIILFLFSNNLFANNISDSRQFIENIGNAIVTFNDREKLISLIDESIDFKWISRFVLGVNYHNFTTEQKTDFTKLYKEFLINTYGPKFDNYKAKSFQIYAIEEKKRYNIVKSNLEIDDGTKISFAFRIKRNKLDNQYKIIDIIVEKVSLIETQRAEFSSVIAQNNIAYFLDKMDEKVQKQKLLNQNAKQYFTNP
jgi:phospholipid transport system substrate-binding protein